MSVRSDVIDLLSSVMELLKLRQHIDARQRFI